MDTKKVAVVSGANRGIGKEVVKQLAEIGFEVIATGRSIKKLEKLKLEIKSEISIYGVDVSSDKSCKEFERHLTDNYDKIDVLINNAGIMGSAPLSVFDISQIEIVLNTNLIGAIRLTKSCISLLKRSNDARIINISSEMGEFKSLDGSYAAYRLSKWALNGFTIMLSKETAGSRIKVNAMCPGWCKTEMGGNNAPRSASEGAETVTWLATSNDTKTGVFYSNKNEISW